MEEADQPKSVIGPSLTPEEELLDRICHSLAAHFGYSKEQRDARVIHRVIHSRVPVTTSRK